MFGQGIQPETVSAAIGYEFRRQELLRRSLTHRSHSAENNERLEFLGDSVLELIVTDALFQRFPQAHEGVLTRLRARIVRRETLAALARTLNIGLALQLGPGELKSGGRERDSILADAFEALVGAIYLDAGLARCTTVILPLLESLLGELDPRSAGKDPKTRLQEHLQARGLPLPVYRVENVIGEAHAQHFQITCGLDVLGLRSQGAGSSRRKAEQRSAEQMLKLLEDSEPSEGHRDG